MQPLTKANLKCMHMKVLHIRQRFQNNNLTSLAYSVVFPLRAPDVRC